MKITLYTILQAVAGKFQGIKMAFSDGGPVATVFSSPDEARDYLTRLLQNIKKEQSQGTRPKNNLDPKESLDFLIAPMVCEIDDSLLIKRGWKLK